MTYIHVYIRYGFGFPFVFRRRLDDFLPQLEVNATYGDELANVPSFQLFRKYLASVSSL
jgi:hypothetical protein